MQCTQQCNQKNAHRFRMTASCAISTALATVGAAAATTIATAWPIASTLPATCEHHLIGLHTKQKSMCVVGVCYLLCLFFSLSANVASDVELAPLMAKPQHCMQAQNLSRLIFADTHDNKLTCTHTKHTANLTRKHSLASGVVVLCVCVSK